MILCKGVSPCKGCTERCVTENYNCHMVCEKYIQFRAKIDSGAKERELKADLDSYVGKSIARCQKPVRRNWKPYRNRMN